MKYIRIFTHFDKSDTKSDTMWIISSPDMASKSKYVFAPKNCLRLLNSTTPSTLLTLLNLCPGSKIYDTFEEMAEDNFVDLL